MTRNDQVNALTVLSDIEILEALKSGIIGIAPFSKKRLTPAGYDLASFSKIDINPRDHKLIATLESIKLNPQILGTIYLKSSFAREGVIGSFAAIDPGFRGQLTLFLFNSGTRIVHINKNEPVVQVVFHVTSKPSDKPYIGRYQNSHNIVKSRRRIQ